MPKRYLLDTNICISLLKNKYGIREALLAVGPDKCFVSEITLGELYYGASKSGNKEERIKDVDFVAQHSGIVPVFQAWELYGDIKSDLENAGTRLDDFDILIGSTAIIHGLVMVTDNVKHLERLPGIVIENWTQR